MSNDLRDLISKVKPFLRQYLESTGTVIRNDGKFICPSPAKHDDDPSANFVPNTNNTVAHCFGCGANFDIFTAAHWKEGLPQRGKAWVHQTVYALARRFGVQFSPGELSDEDAEVLNLRRIYEDAYEVLRSFWENRTHLDTRGWPAHLCYQMGVATVTSWQDFLRRLQGIRNYSKAELDRAGIKPKYFHENAITFTLFDEFGSPIGFAMRDQRFNEENKGDLPKYQNTHTNLVFNKKSLVYGLHRCRGKGGPIHVVEGYADVMSALTFGIDGVVAICGSKPTTEQIAKLEENDKRDIVLTLDHDTKPTKDGRPTGQAKTEEFLDAYVAGRRAVRLRVLDWPAAFPEGKMDLDSFLMGLANKGHGPEEVVTAWDMLPRIESFDWKLRLFPEDATGSQVSQQMIPIIASEPVHAKQEELLNRLAEHVGIRKEALQRDLDATLDLQAKKTRDQVQRIFKRAYSDSEQAKPEEAEQILQEAHAKVKAIIDSVSVGKADVGSSLEQASAVLDGFMAAPAEMRGLVVGMDVFDKKMNGLCPGMWVFGGFPNVGKSSCFAQLSWNAACYNPDAVNLVMTLDDSLEEWLAKYLALQTQFPIGHVAHPNFWLANDATKLAEYNRARETVTDLMSTGRLEVRDASMGTSSGAMIRWVDKVRARHPKKKIAVWLDNFHSLTDPGPDAKTRFSEASKKLKLLSRVRNCFIGMTAELVKNDDRRRPTRKMLKETGTIEYDATGVILVHNDLDVNPDTDKVWDDPHASDMANRRKPILEWFVDKNKNLYGAWKGVVQLQFNPECSQITEYKGPSVAVPEPTYQQPSSTEGRTWE